MEVIKELIVMQRNEKNTAEKKEKRNKNQAGDFTQHQESETGAFD